jgi:acetylornithine/succinyldiaminopimelate/putrescine aminotransferase
MIYSIKKIQRYFGTSTLKLPIINHKPREYTGPSYENIVQERKDYMCQFYSHFYKQPLLITEGYYQYLYDHKANRYLDLVSGISTVCLGHSHPAITKVVQDQISKLTHTSPVYLS